MSRLFKRIAKVQVVSQPSGFIGSNPQFFETLGNALEITDLRIQFEVSRNLGKEPNKTIIKIYNLAETTRTELEKGAKRVTLLAGYDGVARLLAVGDLRRAFSEREGPDIVTTLQVGDGLRAYAHARMSRSYKPPITVQHVLGDAAKSMGLTLPDEIARSPELAQAVANGISTHGPTRDVLTRLLAPYGYGWSVQNGHLQVLRDGDLKPGEAFLVNTDSGLINSPKETTPEKPKGKSEVEFDTLLWPELAPGLAARLESEFFAVNLKMIEAGHTGDTLPSGDWKTSVKGRPL